MSSLDTRTDSLIIGVAWIIQNIYTDFLQLTSNGCEKCNTGSSGKKQTYTALNAIPVLQKQITNVVTPSFMPEFTDNLWTTKVLNRTKIVCELKHETQSNVCFVYFIS